MCQTVENGHERGWKGHRKVIRTQKERVGDAVLLTGRPGLFSVFFSDHDRRVVMEMSRWVVTRDCDTASLWCYSVAFLWCLCGLSVVFVWSFYVLSLDLGDNYGSVMCTQVTFCVIGVVIGVTSDVTYVMLHQMLHG